MGDKYIGSKHFFHVLQVCRIPGDRMKVQKKDQNKGSQPGPTPFRLRVRLNGQDCGQPSTSNASANIQKSKAQNWRDKLRENDPERYKAMKKDAKEYAQLYRLKCATATLSLKRNATDEERAEAMLWQQRKEKNNESAKLRMRKITQRKKADAMQNKRAKKPMTRNQHEAQKEKERLKKRRQRAEMSQEQKAKVLAKRREQYHKRRADIREKELEEERKRLEELAKELAATMRAIEGTNDQLPQEDALDLRSQNAKAKALERVRKSLPRRRKHCINTSIDLIAKATPTKAAAFEEAGLRSSRSHEAVQLDEAIVNAVSEGLRLPKKSIARRSLASSLSGVKRMKLQRAACRKFGVSRKLLANAIKRVAGRKPTPLQTIQKITEYYEANSRILPDKKMVSKKTGKPGHVLETPVSQLYENFIVDHPDHRVGAATFHRLRPSHVKLKSQAKYVGCLCEYCENVRLKINSINHQQPGTFSGLYDISHHTLCEKAPECEFHDPSCIKRDCESCGVDKICDKLLEIDQTKPHEWKRWEMMETQCHMQKETKTVKKRGLITKSGTFKEMVDELKDELKPFSEHLFIKDWQHKQQCALQKNLRSDEVLSVFDFAENFTCYYQREVQSAHYTQESATVHPVVTYYLCPECENPVTESCVMISDDLNHDYNLVNRFQEIVADHLLSTRRIRLRKFIRFSDGCSSQYKRKGPISDVSYGQEDFGITIHHNYSGTRHGKGASDGESGVVKRNAAEAIKAGVTLINNARSLHDYLKEMMTRAPEEGQCCATFRRTMFYVSFEDVRRDRPNRAVRTVPGTRKLHSVKGLQGGVVATRNLSCFCEGCEGEVGTCKNTKYVDPWKIVKLDRNAPGNYFSILFAAVF